MAFFTSPQKVILVPIDWNRALILFFIGSDIKLWSNSKYIYPLSKSPNYAISALKLPLHHRLGCGCDEVAETLSVAISGCISVSDLFLIWHCPLNTTLLLKGNLFGSAVEVPRPIILYQLFFLIFLRKCNFLSFFHS